MSIVGKEVSLNTHRVFKVSATGRRVFLFAGSAESCATKAMEFGQLPQHQGHKMIIEAHDGKDPR